MPRPAIPREWLPTIPRRYASTAIDGLLIIAAIVVPIAVWPGEAEVLRLGRIAIALGAIFIYEPLCTALAVTLGQRVVGIRVRRFDTGGRISLLHAYARIVVKVLLGFISFFSLPLTPGRRAFHDLASGAIVIMADAESEFVEWTATAPQGAE